MEHFNITATNIDYSEHKFGIMGTIYLPSTIQLVALTFLVARQREEREKEREIEKK